MFDHVLCVYPYRPEVRNSGFLPPLGLEYIAAIIKPCFLPDEGCVWVDADMASFEVRIFAHLVAAYNDELARIYAENPNMDFHQWVADTMGIVRNASYSGEVNAKQLNLSMIFNSGNGAIADKLGLPWNWESFKNRQGEVITYFAGSLLDREGTNLAPSVTATFSGGGTVTATAVMDGSLPINDQDAFFGFVAPAGESIVNVNFDISGYSNLDDVAFITSAFTVILSPILIGSRNSRF